MRLGSVTGGKAWGFCFLLVLTVACSCRCEEVELFILWGINGRWDGNIRIENGRFVRIEPYSFESHYYDRWLGADERGASWRSGVGGQFDGIHFVAQADGETRFFLKTLRCEREFRLFDFPEQTDRVLRIRGKKVLLVLGRGDPNREPRLPRSIPLPPIYRKPRPANPVRLPDDYRRRDVIIRLSEPVGGGIAARRLSNNDGWLYVELYSPKGALSGKAYVEVAGEKVGSRELRGSLFPSMKPRIGTMRLRVAQPSGGSIVLTVPTTLVETRGSELYLNGEPFLVKGTLPRNLNDEDAAYLKSL